MRHILLVLLGAITIPLSGQPDAFLDKSRKMQYSAPANVWEEALPLGNGRLGAMVFGKTGREIISLNEETLWTGPPEDWNNPEAKKVLPLVRKNLFEGNYQYVQDSLMTRMQGPFTQSYAPLGDLLITFTGDTTASQYTRTLDIEDAIAKVNYVQGGNEYIREIFVSHPDEMIVIRLQTLGTGTLNFDLQFQSRLRNKVDVAEKDELILTGYAPIHADPSYLGETENPIRYEPGKGITFAAIAKVLPVGGTLASTDSEIEVRDAREVFILVSAATSYEERNFIPVARATDPLSKARLFLRSALLKPYNQLLNRHIEDYQKYFNRVDIQLGTSDKAPENIPERLIAYHKGAEDPDLEEMYFQFGRYLMISASRPGGQAMNLQGIWNPHMRPPWSSNYTININTEMNYWPAEVGNLPELHEPLFGLIKKLSANGAQTARVNYGARGWVSHHNTDIWGHSAPVGGYGSRGPGSVQWANWYVSNGWLCQHLWEHYEFGRDYDFLKETAYPIMEGAALFFLDWLIENEEGYLVTAPSTSPENTYTTPDGQKGAVAIGATMDMAIIWDLFTNCIEALEVLQTDEEFRQTLIDAKSRLLPTPVGKYGQIQEWSEDWDNPEDKHRHISHLFGLHPGRQIHPTTTPQLAEAAQKTLEMRGDEGTGWSKGWKINFWARLLEGDHAYKMIRSQLTPVFPDGQIRYSEGGGTYPNLFDAHPPFQIDGNFGATAGMAELLLQSHLGEIHLLPALPGSWDSGSIQGLRARGGFEVDITWQEGKLQSAVINSRRGGHATIRYKDKVVDFETEGGKRYILDGDLNY